MLSQDDRRQLEMIANHLELEDPEFAQALRAGWPRRPHGDRRLPLALAAVTTGLMFLVGLLAQAIVVMLLAPVAFGCAAGWICLHVRRSQRRPIRRGRPSA